MMKICPNGLAYSLKRALFCLDDASKVDGTTKAGWSVQRWSFRDGWCAQIAQMGWHIV